MLETSTLGWLVRHREILLHLKRQQLLYVRLNPAPSIYNKDASCSHQSTSSFQTKALSLSANPEHSIEGCK